jgi:hypothetical protein
MNNSGGGIKLIIPVGVDARRGRCSDLVRGGEIRVGLRWHSDVHAHCLVSRQVSISRGTNLAVRAWLRHVNGGVSGFLDRKNTEALGAVESCESHSHHQLIRVGTGLVWGKQCIG